MVNSWQFVLNTCAAPELVVDGQLGGALAEGGHVLVVGRVGRAADGDVGNLCCEFHIHYIYWLDISFFASTISRIIQYNASGSNETSANSKTALMSSM